jgi:hypothetical protein
MQNTDPEGYDVFVRSLAAAGNPAAGFLAGIDDIFGRNRGPRPPLDELHRATQAGHRGAAYVVAVVLYRFYSEADADGNAFASCSSSTSNTSSSGSSTASART